MGIRARVVVLSAALALLVPVLAVIATPAASTSGGDPYVTPVAVDANPAPNVFETTIVAETKTVDIGGGVMANAMVYNGAIPGPQLRVKQNDTVIVHFFNRLPAGHNTSIHWHGIELDNRSDGTSVTQNHVHSGGNFLYKFTVPRPGIYWYHPHTHHSTDQAFKGLYGSIIVSDPNEAALIGQGVLPGASNTRTLVLSDMTVCKTPGMNDPQTYPNAGSQGSTANPNGAPPTGVQPGPTPFDLCEGSPINEDGSPRGAPFNAGDIPNTQKALSPTQGANRVNEGQTVLTNGKNVGGRAGYPALPGGLQAGASVLNVTPGQGLRLQIVNAATTRFMRLIFTTNAGVSIPLVQVGGDNGLFDAAVVNGGVQQGFDFRYNTGELLLLPGDRADVVAAIPPAATGVATLWTGDFPRAGGSFTAIPTVPVAHFNVTGTPGAYSINAGTPVLTAVGAHVEVLPSQTGDLLDPAAFIGTKTPPAIGSASETMALTNVGPGNALGFDNVQGWTTEEHVYTDTTHLASTRWAKIGDVLELAVANPTSADHPYHLHGFSMQPVSLTKGMTTFQFNYASFEDNIDVPPGATYRFRVRLDDHPQVDGTTTGGALGRWFFHCHIFFHHGFGMISELVVVKDASGLQRPYIDADLGEVDALIGGPATTTGTFVDPNGLPVTLTASTGTVVKTGATTWSWSLPTFVGMPRQIVYVTATNSSGVIGQTAFQLNPRRAIISGSGTVLSPAGSYPANASLSGTASFGFYTSFETGGGTPATTPAGALSFGFGAAGFSFTATSQANLKLQEGTGSFTGQGKVNGVAGYSYKAWFVDGSPDRFRIQITVTATNAVYYDNLPGGADDAVPPTLNGGAVTIANK